LGDQTLSKRIPLAAIPAVFCLATAACLAQSAATSPLVDLDRTASQSAFPIAANGQAAAIYVAPQNPDTVRVAAEAFAEDVERVTGVKPVILTSLAAPLPANLIIVGVLGKSPEMDSLRTAHRLVTTAVEGKWESAETVTILNPPSNILRGVHLALVIAASDRRGAAYALFTLSRQIGVSPWTWWADVPVAHHAAIYVRPGLFVQPPPSVQYRGIFLNDEDWGLRPWASKKMDPTVDNGKGNIGPRTYERIFELLLRLHANSLWPAMHPGSLAFNAVPENAKLAEKWGIVMGSSHSEALLRNNVGEWNEKTDGPWNYQKNAPAMNAYWDKRLAENGGYENFYTVGLRGVHDSGLEAAGSPQVKAKLVEDVMTTQRAILARHISPDLAKIPQIIWLYKESLDLYRVGMKIPDDVTLGWTDDNYGYIRELPSAAEQARPGGSGVYYHVSYWGAPHDHLWLSTTPPALIREEMTKAYDHNARKYWILNVGDLKPAEIDIDYFMQLATDEPRMAQMSQHDFLTQWTTEQFPAADAPKIADVMTRYYALNFIRKPEFMGFNGYNDGINRTSFNPLAWGTNGEPDQNHARSAAWSHLRDEEAAITKDLPPAYATAFFELVAYPVEASAAQNEKFLSTDLTFLDARPRRPRPANRRRPRPSRLRHHPVAHRPLQRARERQVGRHHVRRATRAPRLRDAPHRDAGRHLRPVPRVLGRRRFLHSDPIHYPYRQVHRAARHRLHQRGALHPQPRWRTLPLEHPHRPRHLRRLHRLRRARVACHHQRRQSNLRPAGFPPARIRLHHHHDRRPRHPHPASPPHLRRRLRPPPPLRRLARRPRAHRT
jgi:hypothetical protein